MNATKRRRYSRRDLPSDFRIYDANRVVAAGWVDLYRVLPNGKEEWVNDFSSVDSAVAAALILKSERRS
jgi:hypothetical protein